MVELHKGMGMPEALAQLLPGDHFSRPLKKHAEDLKGVILDMHFAAILEEFVGKKIHMKWPKAGATMEKRMCGKRRHEDSVSDPS